MSVFLVLVLYFGVWHEFYQTEMFFVSYCCWRLICDVSVQGHEELDCPTSHVLFAAVVCSGHRGAAWRRRARVLRRGDGGWEQGDQSAGETIRTAVHLTGQCIFKLPFITLTNVPTISVSSKPAYQEHFRDGYMKVLTSVFNLRISAFFWSNYSYVLWIFYTWSKPTLTSHLEMFSMDDHRSAKWCEITSRNFIWLIAMLDNTVSYNMITSLSKSLTLALGEASYL